MKPIRRLRRLLASLCIASLSACGGGGSDESAAHPDAQVSTTARGAVPDKRALASAQTFSANGWYWNPVESGTGFMFEAQGNRGFVGFFMYEEGTGNPIWYVAYGDLTPGAAVGEFNFSGNLGVYSGGKPVGSTTYTSATPSLLSVGTVVISFAGNRANVVFPGGRTMPAERYPIDGSGVDFSQPTTAPRANQPEVGWYWNPAEGGRGYAIEVQNDKVFMAVFHYNFDGSPTWNLVQGDIAGGTAVEAFQMTSGGQSLTSAYRSGARDLLGPFTMSFRSACAGQLQLFGAPPITVRRFAIDGSTQPAGSECRTLATQADVPGNQTTSASLAPGEGVFGQLDSLDDADDFRIMLVAGTTYTFDLLGLPSNAGTLADPRLELYGADMTRLAQNDNRAAGSRESRIVFTAPNSGPFFLRALSWGGATGSYLLTASGIAPVIRPQVLSSDTPEGNLSGRLRGQRPGDLLLALGAAGGITGSFRPDDSAMPSSAVSGSVTPEGVVRLATTDGVRCIGFLSGGSVSAACGQSGMLAGRLMPAPVGSAQVGGILKGLGSGEQVSMVLNGGSPITVTGNGGREGIPFTMPTLLARGETYRITAVPSNGAVLSCLVENGVGAMVVDVAHVVVSCTSGRSDAFGEGLKRVGLDIAPGLYRSINASDASCYWTRLSDTRGESKDILAIEIGGGPRLVQILPTDVAFESRRCGTWSRVTGPVTARTDAPFGDGVYLAGVDLQPGLWRSSAMATSCSWARLSNMSGSDDILAIDIGSGQRVVEILSTDGAFRSSRCGTWSRVTGAITVSPSSPFNDGIYLVGVDILPGRWSSDGTGTSCYWVRLRNVAGAQDVIDIDVGAAPTTVVVDASDVAFEARGCGTWKLVQ